MTLDEIDAALADWSARLAATGGILLDLDDRAAYQRLRRVAPTLSGVTLARLGPVLPRIDALWQSQSQLSDIVHQAQSLRPALGHLWGYDSTLRQLEFLLTGASARLPSPTPPLVLDGPLPTPASALTPVNLFAQMVQDLTAVQLAVGEVEAAWNRAETGLAAAAAKVAELSALADTLDMDIRPALETARREISALTAQAETDPLGVGSQFTLELSAFLRQAQAPLAAERERRERLAGDFARAQGLLSALGPLAASCRVVQAEHQTKIEAPLSGIPAIPDVPADLAPWLERIEAARQARHWKPAEVGLTRWLAAAEAARAALATFHAKCTADLERRDELRGLLRALQAKAAAQARRGAVLDLSLPAIAAEAEGLLHGRPTPLGRASALVADYERRLVG